MEEELAAGLSEWEVAEFVHDDEVEPGDEVGQPPLLSATCLRLKPIDEVDDVEVRGREGAGSQRKVALEDLFRLYYKPVYRFFQKALAIEGRHLDDVTQDFFTRFVEKDFLKSVAQEKSFRGFLKVACRRHYVNWRKAQQSAKRGGGRTVSLQDAGEDAAAVHVGRIRP